MQKLTLTIESNLNNVALIGTAIQGLCVLTPLPPSIADIVQLCVVEAINNAIEHAYANQIGHQVVVIVELQPDRLMVDVIDAGDGMEPELINFIHAFDFNPEDVVNLPIGGFGLAIIKDNMDELHYFADKHTHTLRMIKLF